MIPSTAVVVVDAALVKAGAVKMKLIMENWRTFRKNLKESYPVTNFKVGEKVMVGVSDGIGASWKVPARIVDPTIDNGMITIKWEEGLNDHDEFVSAEQEYPVRLIYQSDDTLQSASTKQMPGDDENINRQWYGDRYHPNDPRSGIK